MRALLLIVLSICAVWAFADPETGGAPVPPAILDSSKTVADTAQAEATTKTPAPVKAEQSVEQAAETAAPADPEQSNPVGYDEFYASSSERGLLAGRPDVLSTELSSSDSLGVLPDEMITNFQGGTRRVPVESTVFRREDPVSYEANGRRDPFRALVVDEKKEGAIETDLLRLEKAVLTGTVWSNGEFVAMVRDQAGENFLLHEGDPVYNGRCTAITKTQAIFDVVEFGDYQQIVLKVTSAEKPIKIIG